jgi:TP901 family phage tail tape measure protein
MSAEILSLEVREDGSRVVTRKISDLGRSAIKTDQKVKTLQKDLRKFGDQVNPINQLKRALGGVGAALALGAALKQSLAFGDAIAEVSTLVDEAVFSMDDLSQAAKDQAVAFGSQPVQQSKALYQIISAGATDTADAVTTLTAANKLAVGGVTDVAIAADGLTTILNAYGAQAGSASDISDTLFVGMRAGKTTIEELSSSLGKVVPLAEALGVPFEELVGATAALTKGGISTRESITGLRAVMAAIAKPSQEASDTAEDLGIQFDIAGLQARGFAGFMEHLVEKTGGSKQALTQLFGGVEALVPVMALAGKAGDSFAEIMGDMGDKTGETEKALKKITESEGFKFRKFLALLNTVMISVGDVLAMVLVPALDLLVTRFDDVVLAAGAFIAVLAIANINAIGAAIVALTVKVRLLTVAMAANPIGLLVVGIAAAISALVFFRNEIKLGTDKILSLRDFAVAAFQLIAEKVAPLKDILFGTFDEIGISAKSQIEVVFASFKQMLDLIKRFLNAAINAFVIGGKAISASLIWGFKNAKAYLTGGDPIGFGVFISDLTKEVNAALKRDYVGELAGSFKKGFDDVFDAIEKRALELKKIRDDAAAVKAAASGGAGTGLPVVTSTPAATIDTSRADALKEINDELAREKLLLEETSPAARELKTQLFAIQDRLAGQDIFLSEDEVKANFEGMLKLNKSLMDHNDALESIKGPQDEFKKRVADIKSLLASGDITSGEANSAISGMGLLDFEGTQFQLDGFVEQHRLAFEQIAELRNAELIDATTAGQLRVKADAELANQKLAGQMKYYDALAGLASSKSSKLAAIGKAAAVTQATIQGYQAIQGALAAPPFYPANLPMVAAVTAMQAVNIAGIATARRLGGDINQGQMSRVGEGSRPEVFKNSSTGEQFFIPPERGRVEPMKSGSGGQGGGSGNQSQAPAAPQVAPNVAVVLDVNQIAEAFGSQEASDIFVTQIGNNAQEIKQKLGIR